MSELHIMNKKELKKDLSKSAGVILLNQILMMICFILFFEIMVNQVSTELFDSSTLDNLSMLISVPLSYIPVYIYMRKQGLTLKQQFNKSNVSPTFIWAAFAICLGISGVIGVFNLPIELFFNHYGYTMNLTLESSNTLLYHLTNFTYVVLLGPIFEELVYRGGILAGLRKYGDRFAIIISSLLFGMMHGNIQQFLSATIVGFLLGYIYIKTNSLRISILVHIANNLFAVLLHDYLYPIFPDSAVVWLDWSLTLVIVFLGGMAFYYCYKHISLPKNNIILPISPFKAFFTRIPFLLFFLYTIFFMYTSITPLIK